MTDGATILDTVRELYRQGRLSGAERRLKEFLFRNSDDAEANYLMGLVCTDTERPQEAERCFRRTLEIDPGHYDALEWLAGLIGKGDRASEGVELCRRAIAVRPDDPSAYNTLGLCYISMREPDSAIEAFQQALSLRPEAAYIYHNLSAALLLAGRWPEAIEALGTVVDINPTEESSYIRLGELMLERMQFVEAIERLNAGLTHLPRSERLFHLLALAYGRNGQPEEAEAAFRRSIEVGPSAAASYGFFLQEAGRIEESFPYFERSVAANPIQGQAYYGLIDRREDPESELLRLERMRALANEPRIPERERLFLLYALGKALERAEQYEAALRAFDRANDIAFATVPDVASFDAEWLKANDDDVMQRFTRGYIERLSRDGSPSTKPLFIVGMPRSGTSLLDQILSAHSQVGAAGERQFWMTEGNSRQPFGNRDIEPAALADMAERYLADLEGVQPHSPIVTDKMPTNFLYLGLIAATFPASNMVHIRRNPLDTFVSIYTTYMGTTGFAYRRENIVAFYREYVRMMDYWHSVIPAPNIVELSYEKLVAEPEPTIRRLLEELGLPWEDACLHPEKNRGWVHTPSRWQTRQPIYTTSTERWRSYAPWLSCFADLSA